MDLSNLNQKQREAAQSPHAPLLIVAGAGTGKTRTLTSRLLHLIAQGVPPAHICAVTFTNKAAREMAERVAKGKGRITNNSAPFALGNGPFIGTFHSLGARILRAEARELGRTENFIIFDDHDTLSAIRKVLKELDVKGGKPARHATYISFVKSGAAQDMRVGNREERAALERYESFLMRNNAFDFDDLIIKTTWLFAHRPAILAKYRERYTHVLVDEYQDVSPAQYSLIQLLAGKHRNLSVVGDDAQMIYGWRYANLDTFLNFERDWPGARVVLLEENYRSSAIIVQAASAVIANNRTAREKNLWTRNADGANIVIAEAANEDDEAGWISGEVEEVYRLKGEKKNADTNFSPSPLFTSPTIAILYRTNAQSRALEQSLLRRGIPYKIYGGLKFYERREIKDIVAGLRLAANPRDEISRERLLKTFRVRVFESLLPALAQCETQTPAIAIQAFLNATDYFEYLESNTINADERRENIAELLRFAESFTDIPTFLEHVALVQATDDIANSKGQVAERDALFATSYMPPVHLSTIHLAKGLEFDRVFLAGCTEGILPHARSMDAEKELEEERRLMYVAMTRARKELAVSFYSIPSRFIGEIPPEFTDFTRTAAAENENKDEDGGSSIQVLE